MSGGGIEGEGAFACFNRLCCCPYMHSRHSRTCITALHFSFCFALRCSELDLLRVQEIAFGLRARALRLRRSVRRRTVLCMLRFCTVLLIVKEVTHTKELRV